MRAFPLVASAALLGAMAMPAAGEHVGPLFFVGRGAVSNGVYAFPATLWFGACEGLVPVRVVVDDPLGSRPEVLGLEAELTVGADEADPCLFLFTPARAFRLHNEALGFDLCGQTANTQAAGAAVLDGEVGAGRAACFVVAASGA